jgi:hypothetical protein
VNQRSEHLRGQIHPGPATYARMGHARLTEPILTATTNSDELSYGLNDTAVDGFWVGSNWESAGEAPLADMLASIIDSAPYDGAAACAEERGVINCK